MFSYIVALINLIVVLVVGSFFVMFGGGSVPGMMGTGFPYSGGMYPSYGGAYSGGLGMPQQLGAVPQQEQGGNAVAKVPPEDLHPQINLTTIIR